MPTNLSAPPHWTSFVDWGKQCKGIVWGNAEKATPEGPDEAVRYKSMREFPVKLKYASGVYVKKMYKIDSKKHKREHEMRMKEMEKQAKANYRNSKCGRRQTPNLERFEKIMGEYNNSASATKASVILRCPVPAAMLEFLRGSGLKLSSTNDTTSNGIEHKTQVYTGAMADLYTLFQEKKSKVVDLLKLRVRFESSNWALLNKLFPYVKPVFKKLHHKDIKHLTPGPPHVKLDGGMCHLNSIYDVVNLHPPPGTVYVWLTRNESQNLDEAKKNFLVKFDQSLLPKPKRKRPKTTVGKAKPVTYARGCATANFLDSRSPIKSFPTHKIVHWRLQEKKREMERAKTAMLIDQDMREKEKEKARQRDKERAKTAAILNRRKKKKMDQQRQRKEMQHRKNLIQLEEDGMPDSMIRNPVSRSKIAQHRVHTPIPYPTKEQQNDFLSLNSSPTSLYNLHDGGQSISSSNLISPRPHTILDRSELSTAPAFRSQLNIMQKRSRRRERKIVENAERLHPTMSIQPSSKSNAAQYDQFFRVKTLCKIDNVVGDVPLDAQQSAELKWRIDLINQSVLSMYYPNAVLSSPPSPPLSRQTSPDASPDNIKLWKLSQNRKYHTRKAVSKPALRRGTGDDDPVKSAKHFVTMVKRRAEEKFLKAHPKAKELREQWKSRLRDGTHKFTEDELSQSLYDEAKRRQKEKSKERLALIVDHMKDVRHLLSREVRGKKKRLREIAKQALWAAQREKLRLKKEERKRLKAIRDAASAAAEAKRVKYWKAFIDPQSKLKYWHHKYWGMNVFQEKEPLDIRYFDLREIFKFQLDMHKFHVLRDPDTKRLYIHDIEKRFCRWYKYDDFEMYCIIKIQSVLRQYLGASRFDRVKKNKTVTPLQARARGWLLRKKTYETKVQTTLEKVTLTHIAKEKSRITSYEDLWKVVEEPKPKKKKKFKRRV